MSDITDWLKTELYPTLFEHMAQALPEFKFTRYPGGWRSIYDLRLRDPETSVPDMTVVSKNAPGVISEQEGDVLGLVDYVMRRDEAEFMDAVKTLANAAGLELPANSFYDAETYRKYNDQATILERCNSFFTHCLENITITKENWDYLAARGYSKEVVKAMELGYMPGQYVVFDYFMNRGFDKALLEEVIKVKADDRIGATHKLTIPFRSGGIIKGFVFRTLGDELPAYLTTSGLDKQGGFFNLSGLKGEKELIIVEGEIDSLHAIAKGRDNVVAIGGSTISPAQVKDALNRGAKGFTICLNTLPGKKELMDKNVNAAIDTILGEGVNRVYVATLPNLGEGKKTDPDRLIQEKGIDSFKQAIAGALPYYEYRLRAITEKYIKPLKEGGEPADRTIDSLLDEVIEAALRIKLPIDKDRYKQAFTNLEAIKSLGITGETLSIAIDTLTTSKAREKQAGEFKKLLSEALELRDKGLVEKALDLLNERSKHIKAITGKSLLPAATAYPALLDEIAATAPPCKTGYGLLDKFTRFTPGAISVIAGRPSHGKSVFMLNLLVEMSNLYQDESFYFFTYEEPVKSLWVKLLNRLTATDLSKYFDSCKNLSNPTNTGFIAAYIKSGRSDIKELEAGKKLLRELIESERIKLVDINYSAEELYSLITYLSKEERIGGIFIDYIQRIRTERNAWDKLSEISVISEKLLQAAKYSGLPLIIGAQLNRADTGVLNKKPALEQLKNAGNLEEDAHTILSVYNESREKAESAEGNNHKEAREIKLEIRALKNRDGEINQTAILILDKWTGVVSEKNS